MPGGRLAGPSSGYDQVRTYRAAHIQTPLSCKPAFETLTIFGCAGCGGSLRVPMLRCSEQPKSAVSDDELKAVAREIRHLYWHIRTLRRGYQDAARHRYYRKIRTKKNAC